MGQDVAIKLETMSSGESTADRDVPLTDPNTDYFYIGIRLSKCHATGQAALILLRM